MIHITKQYDTINSNVATTTVEVIVQQENEVQHDERSYSQDKLRQLIREEFPDEPVMVCIAEAESQMRQWDSNGEVVRGIINPKDRGLFQINESYHLENSIKLNYDIYTVKGNIAYARYLYDRNGTQDWDWSRIYWEDCLRKIEQQEN